VPLRLLRRQNWALRAQRAKLPMWLALLEL